MSPRIQYGIILVGPVSVVLSILLFGIRSDDDRIFGEPLSVQEVKSLPAASRMGRMAQEIRRRQSHGTVPNELARAVVTIQGSRELIDPPFLIRASSRDRRTVSELADAYRLFGLGSVADGLDKMVRASPAEIPALFKAWSLLADSDHATRSLTDQLATRAEEILP